MTKTTNILTNTQVKQSKHKVNEYKLSDGQGLQLKVRPSGSKSWVFNYYKPFTKKRTSIGFGSYPEVPLANARTMRRQARELIVNDIDPKAYKEEQATKEQDKLNNTFGTWALNWKELKLKQVKERTITSAYNSLRNHVLPTLSDMPISEVKPKHIIPLMKPLIVLDKRETVKRLCMFINEVMRLAMAAGAIELNPLQDLTKLFPSALKKHQPTITPERLPELMLKINHAQITKVTRCMFELQLHTMTRPVEAATAKWCDFDLDKKVWVIPLERMKMKKPHIIPLSNQLIELLGFVKSFSGHRKYLFPSVKDPVKHANSETVNMMLKRNGFKGQLVSHGMRALASTTN